MIFLCKPNGAWRMAGVAEVKAANKSLGIPEGYLAVPVSQADAGAVLRLCVLARQTPDVAAGSLILLRDLPDAQVYLGCFMDAAGRAHGWVELWVQNVDGLETSLPTYRESVSNAKLDARWSDQAAAFRDLDPENFIQTGWESNHPLPVYLDLSSVQPVQPGNPGAEGRWELCRDENLLRKAGLPSYGTSLYRYLYQPAAGAQTRFIPVVNGAPQGPATVPISTALAGTEHHTAFNPQAGLMMVTGFAPVSFEDYVDLLGGRAWPGLSHGKKRLNFDGIYESLADSTQVENGLGHIFLGLHGKRGRFVEAYHLKLQLLADVFRLVRGHVERRQLPFLNLGAESFRVALKELGTGLPFLWTAKCALVKPEDAFALPVATGEFRYFLRMRGGASVYLPESPGGSTQGSGSVRIRKLLPPDRGRTVVEGTLISQEQLSVSPHDLLWMRLPLPAGRVELYGHLYAGEGLAPGEVRFRTLPQQFDESAVAALKAAEGVPLARAPFEVVPLLSSPCDLYSLGVLAVRTLLVNHQTTLAVALDEVLSLARQVAAEHKPEVPPGPRIRAIFERERRYLESLGPHRMNRWGLSPEEGFGLLPSELWYETLGVLVQLFPGVGPDSFCRDFGDAPPAALETVFNRPLEELEKLLVRSRSLILIDWHFNREINAAIQDCLRRTRS
jgi:hypothetical protein